MMILPATTFRPPGYPDEVPAGGAFPEYEKLATWLLDLADERGAQVLGISGAQGTGKSTLAGLIEQAASAGSRSIVVLSLDDFYLEKSARITLAKQIHPLLRTRGVPGTHDIRLLLRTLAALRRGESVRVPEFDKGRDDRVGERLVNPADLIVLEGWCVAVPAGDPEELIKPINSLERNEDPHGRWRDSVNLALATEYAELAKALDLLIFLAAPDFAASHRWRSEQELALPSARRMDDAALARFMAHYERLSRRALIRLPERADAVVNLNADHTLRDVHVSA